MKKPAAGKVSAVKPKLVSELKRHREVLTKLGIRNEETLPQEVAEHLKMLK